MEVACMLTLFLLVFHYCKMKSVHHHDYYVLKNESTAMANAKASSPHANSSMTSHRCGSVLKSQAAYLLSGKVAVGRSPIGLLANSFL